MTHPEQVPGSAGPLSEDALPAQGPAGSSAPREQDRDAETVQGEAARLGERAAESGRHVGGVAKEEASRVTAEAGHQVRQLGGQARDELAQQAQQQKGRAADTLRSMSEEFRSMAENSETSGTATQLAKEAARRTDEVAHWLDEREPSDMLNDVKAFARRRPGAFLAIAACAGVLAGRLSRGMAQDQPQDDGTGDASGGAGSPRPAAAEGPR